MSGLVLNPDRKPLSSPVGLRVSSLKLQHVNRMGHMPGTGQSRCPGAELGSEASACVSSRGLILPRSDMTSEAFLSVFLRVIPSKQPPLLRPKR